MSALTPIAARELVHLLILQDLLAVRRIPGLTAKGGVNLRLFFGSPRYSEDMDLDGTAQSSAALRNRLRGIFEDRDFTQRLRRFGIRGLDPGEGPNKDTTTTFRYKFGVLAGGGVRYPTKVEVSFRGRHDADETVAQVPDPSILHAYGLDAFDVPHYVRQAAIRQKLEALGGRQTAQARDVFDLHVLLSNDGVDESIDVLAGVVQNEQLQEAYARALAISHAEYEGQVLEFVTKDTRSEYGTEQAWDDMRLRVATFIERVIKRQEQS